ncbi:MAG: PH domain-containing protein [Alphaproteobacteria bacterium]
MPSLSEVQSQITKFKHGSIIGTNKEVKTLPEILDEDEDVVAVTSGFMNNATWLAVCTVRRLIFLNCGMFFGRRQVQLPLDRIQSLDHDFTIFFGSISVWDGASSFTIRMVSKPSIVPFVRATQNAMNEMRRSYQQPRQAATSATSTSGGADIASQIERLAALKEKGHLTDEEFQAQKKKLLGP